MVGAFTTFKEGQRYLSLMDRLSQKESWELFYEYKTSLVCAKFFREQLREFIDREEYLPVTERIARGEAWPLPKKTVISKMSTQKKRTVYTYPPAENMVLKLLTYLLLREYDDCFAPGLFSFRPGHSAKDAIRYLMREDLSQMYSYKVDVSNYFNSIPVDRMLARLRQIADRDPQLCAFVEGLLTEPDVLAEDGSHITEQKGIMAGTPIAAFLANVYLMDLDARFCEAGILYARYSDDIIVFAKKREEVEAHAETIRRILGEYGLGVNPKKESFQNPEDGFTFLGFHVCGEEIDIAPASVEKLKAKMRRKTRSLQRWSRRNEIEGRSAAKAFIRIFNRKLMESSMDNDLTWSFWYFSVLTTTKSLQEIDRYAQDCIRYLITGKRTKARFNARYEQLKELGYKSLVHAFYEGG